MGELRILGDPDSGRAGSPQLRVLGDGDKSSGPSSPGSPPLSRAERFGTGLMDPLVGLLQSGAHMTTEMGEAAAMPFAPAGVPNRDQVVGAVDERVQQRERDIQAGQRAAGVTGTDPYRLAGNIVADVGLTPLMPMPPARVAPTLMGGIGRSAVQGAMGGAVSATATPVTEGGFAEGKAKQISAGAAAGAATGGLLGGLGGALVSGDSAAMEKEITGLYKSSIRPTVVGKRTGRQIEQADQNVISALQSIAGNKESLRLADRYGREVVGRTPQTLDEMVQAIGQTKGPVFEKYHRMAEAAEASGATIDAAPAARELRSFATDPALALPKFDAVRSYAAETANRLDELGALPPTVAETTVRNLNEGLTNFYRAASPENAGKAAVDDLVANHLRRGIDGTLEGMGLPGYQEARLAYGALKSLEGEVAHRAIVYGRRDPGGGVLGRLGNLYSGEEAVRAVVTLNPGHLVTAGAVRGARGLIEWWHSPNRAVQAMFRKIEELQKPPASAVATTTAKTTAAAAPFAGAAVSSGLLAPTTPLPIASPF